MDEKQLDTLLKAVQITSNDPNSRPKPRDNFRGRGNNFGSYFNSGYGSRYNRSGYQRGGGNHGQSGNFNSSTNNTTYNHNGIATTSDQY